MGWNHAGRQKCDFKGAQVTFYGGGSSPPQVRPVAEEPEGAPSCHVSELIRGALSHSPHRRAIRILVFFDLEPHIVVSTFAAHTVRSRHP